MKQMAMVAGVFGMMPPGMSAGAGAYSMVHPRMISPQDLYREHYFAALLAHRDAAVHFQNKRDLPPSPATVAIPARDTGGAVKPDSNVAINPAAEATEVDLYHPDGMLIRSNASFMEWVLKLMPNERVTLAHDLNLDHATENEMNKQAKNYAEQVAHYRAMLVQPPRLPLCNTRPHTEEVEVPGNPTSSQNIVKENVVLTQKTNLNVEINRAAAINPAAAAVNRHPAAIESTEVDLYHPDGMLARSNGRYQRWMLELKAKARNCVARQLSLTEAEMKKMRMQVKRHQLKLSQKRFREHQKKKRNLSELGIV